jgi:hypothetical protein
MGLGDPVAAGEVVGEVVIDTTVFKGEIGWRPRELP